MLGSLRAKITLGYYLIGTLLIGLSLLALLELRLIQQQVQAGEAVTDFFNASLEIRRFEKNFFLYRQSEDLAEQRLYLNRLRELLERQGEAFAALADAARLRQLGEDIRLYQAHMAEYARQVEVSSRRKALEPQIRQSGKKIVDFAEELARRERASLQASLAAHQRNLMISIAVLAGLIVLAGQIVSRRIAAPLKRMEQQMDAVAGGERQRLDMGGGDREIVSLNKAFNHVLAELELRQKHMVRSEKLASLGTMLSGVAHELNNPLSNISTSTQILLEELGPSAPGEQKEMLEQIDEQTERAKRIVRSLLDFARDRPIRRENLPLCELVGECLRFLKAQVPAEIQVTQDVPGNLTIEADRQRLQQVLINLLKNAVEASRSGSEVKISARRYTLPVAPGPSGTSKSRCGIDIHVADCGHGIPAEILPRVFDPFFTTKDVGRGSGLGLFIAHEIIEEHGGTLTVESHAGQGTTFHVRLPDPTGEAP